jgi:hypothetical protein
MFCLFLPSMQRTHLMWERIGRQDVHFHVPSSNICVWTVKLELGGIWVSWYSIYGVYLWWMHFHWSCISFFFICRLVASEGGAMFRIYFPLVYLCNVMINCYLFWCTDVFVTGFVFRVFWPGLLRSSLRLKIPRRWYLSWMFTLLPLHDPLRSEEKMIEHSITAVPITVLLAKKCYKATIEIVNLSYY